MINQPDVYVQLHVAGQDVVKLVSGLDDAGWERPTPAPGWTVAHQIAHLAATFRMAGLAMSDPERFQKFAANLGPDFDANVDLAMSPYLKEPHPVLLDRWREELVALDAAMAGTPPMQVVPWLVRPLPAAVLAAAGMMELVGHGQDIADALGVHREPPPGLTHLVDFISRTWDFGYQVRGLPTPDVELRFEVTTPSGALLTAGPEDSPERVTGPAVDLCLLATRRRHRDDLSLTATGAEADRWLDLAQAYRGPSGPGRRSGQFADAA
jgi:uncharacterized protein (TIGR03084 family)